MYFIMKVQKRKKKIELDSFTGSHLKEWIHAIDEFRVSVTIKILIEKSK